MSYNESDWTGLEYNYTRLYLTLILKYFVMNWCDTSKGELKLKMKFLCMIHLSLLHFVKAAQRNFCNLWLRGSPCTSGGSLLSKKRLKEEWAKPVLEGRCPANLKSFRASAHLIQMNGSLTVLFRPG